MPRYTDLPHFIGTCTCHHPISFSTSGARIAKDLLDSRIKSDASWMVSPWTGPPYDVRTSYSTICATLLDRLSCPEGHRVNNNITYTCTCGKFTYGSTRVQVRTWVGLCAS